jgi:hypothetical protein
MTSTTRSRLRPADSVAGLLAASACFLGGLELFYRPFRLAPLAVILLLISTVMSTQYTRLIRVGFVLVGVCFIVGASLQILTHHPLY